MRRFIASVAAASILASGAPAAAQNAPYSCSEMLGFSETAQWYDGFIAAVPDPGAWQLRWTSGGSVDLWADPNYNGWSGGALTTHCRNGASPDRVVLNISGDYQTDPNWWAAETSQVINIVHSRYPNVRLIALQPVVGGPGGSRCPISSPDARLPFVRATFNYPYIKQGLAMDVGGDVVLGASPEVQSCSDYQAGDWAGHLPPGSAARVGAGVAAFWASNSPSASPADESTSAPAPDNQAPGVLTLNFEDLANPNRALTGQYPAGVIDWGSGAWWLAGPYGAFTTRSISFNGAGPTSATFAFVEPHHLSQLDVYNGGKSDSTVSLACDGTPSVQSNVAAGQLVTLPTGFGDVCSTVTITSTNGWDTNFKNLVIDS